MTEKTIVIFRKWDKSPNSIIAIFPEELGDSDIGTCLSYQHIGQHSACDPVYLIKKTLRASPPEYADLKEELESLGYNLHVVQRNHSHHYTSARLKKLSAVEKGASQ